MDEKTRKLNDPLKLVMSLDDLDDSKFVRVFLTDETNAPISPATVDLTNVGDGVYSDDLSPLMPNKAEVRAHFVIFNDAGYTTIDDEHGADTDFFKLDAFDPSILQPKAAAIFATVQTENSLKGSVEKGSVYGTIETEQKIKGMILGGEIKGTINTENGIKGVVLDE